MLNVNMAFTYPYEYADVPLDESSLYIPWSNLKIESNRLLLFAIDGKSAHEKRH